MGRESMPHSALAADRSLTAMPVAPRVAAPGWLVSPWFDALFLANVAWPLLALAQIGDGFGGLAGLQFWQIYYVTTPHRWITLALVFLDRERLHRRPGVFLGVAAAVAAVCLGVRMTTGALTCLMAIDYLWNAWHFAAQHHGIYRIYGQLGEPGPTPGLLLEKWAMRGFLLYAILRVASATWPETAWEECFRKCDWLIVIVPAWLLLRDAARFGLQASGRIIYLMSVGCLYVTMVWAVHERRFGVVLSLATASALFHAVEYLALVSWSVQRRREALGQKMGLLGLMAARWGIALTVFILVLGAGGWLMDQAFVESWLLLNVIVAFLHYAYDGMIWRRRAI